LYRQFVYEIVEKTTPGGEYEAIRDFAAKLPEHAMRLGAVIDACRDLDDSVPPAVTELSGEDFQRAMQLARYCADNYACAARRLSALKH
jgi:hypothetical protein